ncbi:acyl transferase/acyl hydrolase/lysophospholipase [Xylariales sp. PMI_506]|nr:acyl transferase/acyl hydrolase/lysophospholipase [Xylariales sp. PMI_506]
MTQLVLPSLRITPAPKHEAPSKSTAPKRSLVDHVAVEPLSRALRGAGSLVQYLRGGSEAERESRRLLEERKEILAARMQNAESYLQWSRAAHELDTLEGNETWKSDIESGDYNPDLIQERLNALDDARKSGDMRAMMYLIRTSLSRDLGGMGNIDLYRHSHCGTKKLIERYVYSALETISVMVEQSSRKLPHDLEPKDLLDAVLSARQSFGRSALLLSGGGTFGMSHIGVLKALFEAKLLPRIISGASAGSIVCAVVCTRTDDEIPELIDTFPYGDLAVFEEEGNADGLLDHMRRLLTKGNWSDIKHLTRVMRDLLDDMTFQEAYNRTRRICNICVSSASIYELPRLLNYVTAPNVMIWSAVAASCSVPLVFSAAPLLVKNPLTGEHSPWNPTPQMWIDGSVDNDLPMTRLAEMFNVNHFIVSQVNPHVVPFLAKEDVAYPKPTSGKHPPKEQSDWMYTLTQLAKGEAIHRMHILAEIGIMPNLVTKLRSILSQKYSGDINILPAVGVLDLPKILANPTVDFMLRSCQLGERATWPKVSRIRDHCAIELALDRAVHSLRARVVFSKSQANLRRLATGTIVAPTRGSHEPLSAMDPQPKEKVKTRLRRSSGSNFQTGAARQRHAEELRRMADVDSDDEDSLEMASRKPRVKSRTMKLKRFPTAQGLETGPKTTPHLSSVNEPNAFDFAKPPPTGRNIQTTPPSITPPVCEGLDVNDDLGNTADADETSVTAPIKPLANLPEIEMSSSPSSDADIDSRSDGSSIDVPFGSSDLDPPHSAEEELEHPGSIEDEHMEKEINIAVVDQEQEGDSGDHRMPESRVVDPGAGLWD